jgi:hypothetical protein
VEAWGVALTGIHFLNVRILDFFLVRFAPHKFLPSLNVLSSNTVLRKVMHQHGVPGEPFSCPQHGPPSFLPFFYLKILIKSVITAPWQVKNWNYEEEKAMWKTNHESRTLKKADDENCQKLYLVLLLGVTLQYHLGFRDDTIIQKKIKRGNYLQINKFFPFPN